MPFARASDIILLIRENDDLPRASAAGSGAFSLSLKSLACKTGSAANDVTVASTTAKTVSQFDGCISAIWPQSISSVPLDRLGPWLGRRTSRSEQKGLCDQSNDGSFPQSAREGRPVIRTGGRKVLRFPSLPPSKGPAQSEFG